MVLNIIYLFIYFYIYQSNVQRALFLLSRFAKSVIFWIMYIIQY